MTKDVLLKIVGLHYDTFAPEADEETEPIEVIVPAPYYLKNNKHYIVYDEAVEGMMGTIKSKIKITGEEKLEMMKSGITNTHMIFEKDKIHMTEYATPYGELLVGVYTKDMKVEREKIIAADGATVYMRDKVNEFDDETFDLWMKYHLAICERMDLIGATNHSLDILKKI